MSHRLSSRAGYPLPTPQACQLGHLREPRPHLLDEAYTSLQCPAAAPYVERARSIESFRTRSIGHVLVVGDEWISFDSEWMTMPQIQKMWANWLDWVRPSDVCELAPM